MKDIPAYLDDPQQVLFWEFDEFILLAIMFGIGIMVTLSAHCWRPD
jgi:conjugal transfer pilus assembly protein TraL